jgi:hypothetical protein
VKLTENGKQVGLKATTGGTAPATVTLKPRQTARVALTIQDAGALSRPVKSNGLSVQGAEVADAVDALVSGHGLCLLFWWRLPDSWVSHCYEW